MLSVSFPWRSFYTWFLHLFFKNVQLTQEVDKLAQFFENQIMHLKESVPQTGLVVVVKGQILSHTAERHHHAEINTNTFPPSVQHSLQTYLCGSQHKQDEMCAAYPSQHSKGSTKARINGTELESCKIQGLSWLLELCSKCFICIWWGGCQF